MQWAIPSLDQLQSFNHVILHLIMIFKLISICTVLSQAPAHMVPQRSAGSLFLLNFLSQAAWEQGWGVQVHPCPNSCPPASPGMVSSLQQHNGCSKWGLSGIFHVLWHSFQICPTWTFFLTHWWFPSLYVTFYSNPPHQCWRKWWNVHNWGESGFSPF